MKKKIALSVFVVAASAGYVWSQWSGQSSLASLSAGGGDQIARLTQSASAAPAAPPIQPVPFVTQQTATIPANRPTPAPSMTAETPAEPPPLPKPAAPTQMAALAPAAKPPQPTPSTPPASAPPPAASAPGSSEQMAQAAPINPPLPHPRPSVNHQSAPALLAQANPAPVRHGLYSDGTYTGPVINVFYGLMQIQAVVQNGRLASINILRYPNDRRTSVRINRVALPMLRDEVVTAQSADVNIITGATLSSAGFIRSLDAALRQARA